MFKSGDFVANYLEPHDGGELDDERIQTHGVELTIDDIYALLGDAHLSNDDYIKPQRMSIQTSSGKYVVGPELDGGTFVVQYDEVIEIPDDHVGFVYPRSRLLRCGIHLTTAVWESGYKGRGEGALLASNRTTIESDFAIGQMVMCRAEVLNQYDGTHQGERLTN